MSKKGIQVAFEHAESLRTFSSQLEAERFYFKLRDGLIETLDSLAKNNNIPLDFSPESLKTLEKWYFDLYEYDRFKELGISQKDFERCMGIYIGFVYTKNKPQFEWLVKESSFIKGKYEIGVTLGLCTVFLGPVSNLTKVKDNKRKQYMYREYKKYTQ